MRNSLWAIVVVVIGVVGFLVGYSVPHSAGNEVAVEDEGAAQQAESGPGHGAQPAAAGSAPGYGAQPAAAATAVPAAGSR